MSAGGGPRAAGSGLNNEGKFRQRVDTHYKVMASAKKQIGQAGRLGLGSAMGFGTLAGASAVSDAMPIAILAFVYALAAGVTHRGAAGAAGSVNAEKNAATYLSRLRGLGALLLFVFPVLMAIGIPDLPTLICFGLLWLLGIGACTMGYFSTSTLLDAFRQQKLKAQHKDQ